MANPDHERQFRTLVREMQPQVDLRGLDLSGIRASMTKLEGADLTSANFEGADLQSSMLKGARFTNARLKKAKLGFGDLRDADFTAADLTQADLRATTLTHARLTGAVLVKTSLVKARLDGADLTAADLKGTDLRGAIGLTTSQLKSAKHWEKAILDERTLQLLNQPVDVEKARHGRALRKGTKPTVVDFHFAAEKPGFGDIFQMCGDIHPDFPPTGGFRFEKLADLGIEQVDDYFAVIRDGEPVIWVFPVVRGCVVEHHQGPFDGLRLELADKKQKVLWTRCIATVRETLGLTTRDS